MDRNGVQELLTNVNDIDTKMRSLWDQMDALLNPLLVQARSMPKEDLDFLIARLPTGFHRTELRVMREARFPAKEA